MKIRILATILFSAFLAVTAFAHGDKKHVNGTITKVSSDSIVVKTKDSGDVVVKLVPATVYIFHNSSTDKPAKFADLAVGDLVAIHATPKESGLEADEVKFSTGGSGNVPTPKPEAKPEN